LTPPPPGWASSCARHSQAHRAVASRGAQNRISRRAEAARRGNNEKSIRRAGARNAEGVRHSRVLKCHPSTVYKLVKAGRLPAFRVALTGDFDVQISTSGLLPTRGGRAGAEADARAEGESARIAVHLQGEIDPALGHAMACRENLRRLRQQAALETARPIATPISSPT
jgi:hypothetical protein